MALRSSLFAANRRLNSAANNSPAMKPGERGEAVSLLQQALVRLGYPMPRSTRRDGTLDGIFGREVKTSVRMIEERFELDLDRGIAGRQVLGTIDEQLRLLTEDLGQRTRTVTVPPPTHPLSRGVRRTRDEAIRELSQIDFRVLRIPSNQLPDPTEHPAITFLRRQGFTDYQIDKLGRHLAAGEYEEAFNLSLGNLGDLSSLVGNIATLVEFTGGSFSFGAGQVAFGLSGIGVFATAYTIMRHIFHELPEWIDQLTYCLYYVPSVSGGVTSRVYCDPRMDPSDWLSNHAAGMVRFFNRMGYEMTAARFMRTADRAFGQAHRNMSRLSISLNNRQKIVQGEGPHECWARVGSRIVGRISDVRMRRHVEGFTVRVLRLHTPWFPMGR